MMKDWQQQALPGFVQHHETGATIEERFESFHKANPWVADELEKLADERLAAGVTRFGVKALVERLRWDWDGTTGTSGERWRVNNSHTSRYARLLIERRPDFADAIELRELKAE